MALIKLFSNGIALDFVKETLSIKKENNALITDFKVSYSSVPFLIIENATTVQALGSRDLTSINKKRIIPVDVIELGEKYYGELQILSYVTGYRKCNLKYATEVLTIMNKKIADFMPVVSVIPGETNPIPYTDGVDTNVLGESNWANYPIAFLDQTFPEVKWQFPTMDWNSKFGTDLQTGDDWLAYQGKINGYYDETLILNTGVYNGSAYIIDNKNIVAPQVFLLSPLFYSLQQIGFNANGSFVNHSLIKKILILTTKDNLTKSRVFADLGVFNLEWNEPFKLHYKEIIPAYEGDYYINYNYNVSSYAIFNYSGALGVAIGGEVFRNSSPNPKTFTGTIIVNVPLAQVGEPIKFYLSTPGRFPESSYILDQNSFFKFGYNKPFYQMHTTIETGRFVPDWTVGDYLNQLKNTFNLDISINDLKKEITINFVEDFIINEEKVILNKSLEIQSYEQVPYEAFILAYANDIDTALYINTAGAAIKTTQNSDLDVLIKNKFKFVPMNSFTANLSNDLEDKQGIGLMIYDPANKPFTSESFNGKTLKIEGAGGIHETFWLKTLKFRLNASVLELSGPFSEIELKKIANIKKIYIDNQGYIVSSLEYSETNQENFLLNLKLESINY